MKRLSIFVMALVMLAPMALLSSCGDNDGPSYNYLQAIVTFVRNNGANVEFQYQRIDDSPMITLTGAGNIDTTMLLPGQRVLLTYVYTGQGVEGYSGSIDVVALTRVYQDTVTAAAADTIHTEPYLVNTLYRSGLYLNLQAVAQNVEKREFNLYVDQTTLGTSEPQLYLTTKTVPGSVASYDNRFYGSFYIAPVWNRPEVSAITVHVDEELNPTRPTFRFSK